MNNSDYLYNLSYQEDYAYSADIDKRMRMRGASYDTERPIESSAHYATADELEAKRQELQVLKVQYYDITHNFIQYRNITDERIGIDELTERMRPLKNLQHKIAELQEFIKNSIVIDIDDINIDVVSMLSVVVVRSESNNKSFKMRIVGKNDGNIDSGKLSSESPIGKALIGHAKGDIVSVNGKNFSIVSIGR